jgi:hypothetical protein
VLSIHDRSVAEWARVCGSDVAPHAASGPARAIAASRTAIRLVAQLPAQAQQANEAFMRTIDLNEPMTCEMVFVVTVYLPRRARRTPA